MWLVDRQSDGRASGRIPLPLPVRSALVRWYNGEGTRGDEDAGITLVQQARIGEKWLACDCLGIDQAPPILTPAFLSEAETYYLRRLTSAKRPEHRADCPFFRDQVTHRVTEVRSPESPAERPDGYFEALRPAPEKLAQRPEEEASDDRTRNASVPRLARLLWRLIDVSGLNRISAPDDDDEERSIAREFDAVRAAAHRIQVAPGIELGRVLWTHGEAFHRRRVYAKLREMKRTWPRGHAPQAFLTVFTQGFQGNVIETAGCEPIHIANRIQSPSIRGNHIRGPYLTFVVVGEFPEAHGYAPLRAYAQPVLSGHHFIPVDSEFERTVARVLIAAQRTFRGEGIALAIEKPVFDRLTPIGLCRPDFLLEARSIHTGEVKQLIVEAMGSDEQCYIAAKAASHPRMQRIAPVLSVTPHDIGADTFTAMLGRALDV